MTSGKQPPGFDLLHHIYKLKESSHCPMMYLIDIIIISPDGAAIVLFVQFFMFRDLDLCLSKMYLTTFQTRLKILLLVSWWLL